MNYLTTVLNKTWITHNVFQLSIERPELFTYSLGQAVEISLYKDTEFLKAPFTITSVYEKDKDLQFIIKVYPKHKGVTTALSKLKVTDTLLLSNPWDSFNYNGPGMFIAAGSGITPFIPLFRVLKEKNKIEGHSVIFANRMKRDIILKEELKEILNDRFYNILSRDRLSEYDFGRVDIDYLKQIIKTIDQNFYLCGPSIFLVNVNNILLKLGVKITSIQIIH